MEYEHEWSHGPKSCQPQKFLSEEAFSCQNYLDQIVLNARGPSSSKLQISQALKNQFRDYLFTSIKTFSD